MKGKKYIAGILLAVAIVVASQINQAPQVVADSSQPPTRYTNAPGENNCTSCHSSYSLTTNSSSISVSSTPSDIFTNGYTPGTTYAITLTLVSGYSRYGFEMTCLKTGNTAAGTFARTNTTNTSLQTASSKQYIGHKSASSTNTWSFNWTAPASGTGTVTFYAVGNLANGNSSESGDRIHAKSFAVNEIIVPTCNLTASVTSSTNPNCNGSSDGTATVTPANGTGTYTYLWSNGATTATATGLPAGTASVTVTDAASCTATASVTLTQPSVLSASTSVVNVTVNGQCNGSATASPTGGTGSYTYVWSNSATTATATGLCAGTYTVTVTDAHGCTTTASATITQPAGITASITANNAVTCNSLCNGSATVSASGGSTPYAYHWGTVPVQTTATATGLCAGSYTVTVTDANNSTATQSVTISQPSAVTATATATVATCGQTNGSATVTASGGTSGYTYLWGTAPAQTTATASNLAAGSYTVTVTDAHSCTASTSATVSSTGTLPGSAGSITGSTSLCTGTVTYSVTNQAGVTYTWAVSGGGTVTPNGNSASINWNTTGTYTVSVTPSNSCGSSPPSTLSVTVGNANINAPSITGNTTPCTGNSTYTVTQQAGVTYAWAVSGGGTVTPNGNSATINWNSNGVHTISVTPSNSCGTGTVGTLSVNVGGNVPTTPTITGNTTPCTGVAATYTVAAQNGVTFNWAVSGGGTVTPQTGTSVTITWTTAGSHTINVTPMGSCGAGATGTLTINATQGIVAPGNISGSASVCANSSATYSISPSTGGGSYVWAVSGGGTVTANGTTANVNWSTTGTYTLSVTPTASCGNGTPSTLSVTVTNLPAQPVISGPNDVCANVDQLFTVNGSLGATYVWTVAGNANYIANFDSAVIHWPASGSFNISVMATNSCGSSTNGVKTINVKAPPAISLGNDTSVCGNTTLAVNGSGIGQYLWSDNSTGATLTVSQSGNYGVTVTGTNGCSASDSKQVTVNGLPALNLFDSDGCDSVEVDAGTGFTNYAWSSGEHVETVSFTQNGAYTVTVTDNNGCTASGIVNVVVDHTPLADFTYSINGFTVDFADYSINPGYYIWDFGDGTTDTLANPSHTYAADGAYPVILKVGNSCSQNSFFHTVYVGNVTGIDYIDGNNAVQVYPNPATDNVTINLQGDNGRLEVMNTMGKLVYTGNMENGLPQTIDLSQFASGLYVIKVTGKGHTYYGKVIKR